MKRDTLIRFLALLSLIIFFGACAGYMHGYTKREAQNQYMKVDKESHSFGFKRISYIEEYRGAAITGFLEEKGMPDYLYEFTEDGREGFIFYYLNTETAFVFLQRSWRPDSVSLIDIRHFNHSEKMRFGITVK